MDPRLRRYELPADPLGPVQPLTPKRKRQLGPMLFDLAVVAAVFVLFIRLTSGIRDRTDIWIVLGIGSLAFLGTRYLYRRRQRRF